jgi:hypothetical protein
VKKEEIYLASSYSKMINDILKNNQGQLNITEIKQLIDKCILVLDSAEKYMSEYRQDNATKQSALEKMYNA